MPKTMFQKAWDDHVVYQAPGEPAILYIDLHLVHEVTSPQAFDGLRMNGRKVRRQDLTIATVDHNVPTANRHLPTANRHLPASSCHPPASSRHPPADDGDAEFEAGPFDQRDGGAR